MTQRQSNNQWIGGIETHPTPKFPSAEIRWEISRLDSGFWDQDDILPVDYLPKDQTINAEYCSLHFEVKTPRKVYKRFLILARQYSSSPGTGKPRRNWPAWASSVFITHPILRIWPRRTTTCSLDWKTIERSSFFVRRGGDCCRGDLVGRTSFWFSLSGLRKLEQRAKKCIELRWEYVE